MDQDFGNFVRQRRPECGMTQRQLAEILHISPGYLNDIEHGRRNPPSSRQRIEQFARALQVPADYLEVLRGWVGVSADDVDWSDPDRIAQAVVDLRKALGCKA